MPVVPFTQRPNQSQPMPRPDPTFLMMAAAELHEAGRLIEPQIEDRTNQTSKERDNAMVDDQQLPSWDTGMDKDVFSKLSKEAGSKELDDAERSNIVKAVERGIALKDRTGNIPEYDSRGRRKR